MNFSIFNEFILAVVLGITQGITEFLPVSSTAHQRLVSALITNGRDIGLVASNFIQFGTLIAILQFYRKDLSLYFKRIIKMIKKPTEIQAFKDNFVWWWESNSLAKQYGMESSKEDKILEGDNLTDVLMAQLIVGTLPVIIIGSLLYNLAESNREVSEIAWFLLAGSLLMGFAEYVHTKSEKSVKPKVITPGEVILIGIFQSLAAFPGISRSGATLSGALITGRNRADSVRFSFLLSIPVLLILSIKDFFKLIGQARQTGLSFLPSQSFWTSDKVNLSIISLLISFFLSYIFGIIFLRWLLKYLSSQTFRWFIVYRVLVALCIFILVYLKIL